jgi:hypothetical protein
VFVVSKKWIVIALVMAAGLVVAVVPKVTSTADAANGNCYSGDAGPDTPTICQ